MYWSCNHYYCSYRNPNCKITAHETDLVLCHVWWSNSEDFCNGSSKNYYQSIKKFKLPHIFSQISLYIVKGGRKLFFDFLKIIATGRLESRYIKNLLSLLSKSQRYLKIFYGIARLLTESSKSPASIAKSNKQWVGTCLYQEECKFLLINCGAVIRL